MPRPFKILFAAGLLAAGLLAAAASPALAVTWCHDYALWAAGGRAGNPDRTSPGTLRQQLTQLQYLSLKTFAPNAADADRYLKHRGVVILGDAHSGFVTANLKVDHLIQPPGAPGTN